MPPIDQINGEKEVQWSMDGACFSYLYNISTLLYYGGNSVIKNTRQLADPRDQRV